MSDSPPNVRAVRGSRVILLSIFGIMCCLALRAGVVTQDTGGESLPPLIDALCREGNPMYAAARLSLESDGPAVVLFNDTLQDFAPFSRRDSIPIADLAEVGSVHGVAFDPLRSAVYVASYFHVQYPNMLAHAPFGPGGYGGIYRIDLTTGDVELFASLPAGSDAEIDANFRIQSDAVGVVGLGDIEIDAAGELLFAANLFDQSIYVLSLPDGRLLRKFESGARTASWRQDGRLFGIGISGGELFHGVVYSSFPFGYVYKSRFDGTEMVEATAINLFYERAYPWRPWGSLPNPRLWDETSEPMISDIAFSRQRNMIIGIRDRMTDRVFDIGRGNGDLLLARHSGNRPSGVSRWAVTGASESVEFYRDDEVVGDDNSQEEPLLGSVAEVPHRDEVVATSSLGVVRGRGVVWFDNVTGLLGGVYDGIESLSGEELHEGDVESVCHERVLYLPITFNEACSESSNRADYFIVMDLSSSMNEMIEPTVSRHDAAMRATRALLDQMIFDGAQRNRVAVTGFNEDAWTEVALSSSRSEIETGLDRLKSKIGTGTRIDLALEWTDAELGRLGHDPTGNHDIVMLLSDGLPTGVPPAEDGLVQTTVARPAERIRASGADIVAVGFGSRGNIGAGLLEAIASPGEVYIETSLESLVARFVFLGSSFGCQ